MRILIADDHAVVRQGLKQILAAEFKNSVFGEAVNGQQALDKLRAGERYDVILCDLMMPFMSGIQFYDAIRAIDPEQARRIVFMTGGAYAPLVLEFLSSVANPRIDKPVGRLALRAAIQAIGP